jgi:ATP-binding cassette subfamily G (WHITE) protein 2 (PDR)
LLLLQTLWFPGSTPPTVTMAGLLSDTDNTTENVSQSHHTFNNTTNEFTHSSTSQSHHTFNNTTNEFTHSSTSGHQTNTTTTSSKVHSDGIYRTASGRETYYPDGHETRANGDRVVAHCEHDEHQPTPVPILSRGSYGLFPSQESSTQRASTSRDVSGAGLFSGGNAQETEQEVPLEKVESSSSSDSSTQYGSNGEVKPKKSRSSSDEAHGGMLTRKSTRAEIDEDGRKELQRIFTAQSQKMNRQMSIASPDDPTVDPSSDSFDLARFLKMFRMYFVAVCMDRMLTVHQAII